MDHPALAPAPDWPPRLRRQRALAHGLLLLGAAASAWALWVAFQQEGRDRGAVLLAVLPLLPGVLLLREASMAFLTGPYVRGRLGLPPGEPMPRPERRRLYHAMAAGDAPAVAAGLDSATGRGPVPASVQAPALPMQRSGFWQGRRSWTAVAIGVVLFLVGLYRYPELGWVVLAAAAVAVLLMMARDWDRRRGTPTVEHGRPLVDAWLAWYAVHARR